MVTVAAGENWDDLVARAVDSGWVGVEALSGIPGAVGATPIQNVGAYGQEVSQTIASVRVWDRRLKGIRTFANADCGFGYRTSRFKADPGRHVVLDGHLPVHAGHAGRAGEVRRAGPTLGSSRGSGPRSPTYAPRCSRCAAARAWCSTRDDHDTWSAGSFFTNPVVDAAAVARRRAGLARPATARSRPAPPG